MASNKKHDPTHRQRRLAAVGQPEVLARAAGDGTAAHRGHRRGRFRVVRAHPYKDDVRHGFIASQREGIEVFKRIDPQAPLIVAEAVWQYSHHVLAGLTTHRGPILTVANWSGTWPGLVGMLNLNGSLTKAGVAYSTLWSEDFTDRLLHHAAPRMAHHRQVPPRLEPCPTVRQSRKLDAARRRARRSSSPRELLREKAIMGVFDEGCMGMFNAIIPDHLLHRTGVFKERLSQSALYYETTQVSDAEAAAVRQWMEERGMRFHTGPESRDRSHRPADSPAVQDVHRRRAIGRRLRLRPDRHPVSAGSQGPAAGQRSGRGHAQQLPTARRSAAATASACCSKASRWSTSTKWTKCAGLDALLTYRVQKATGQPVETTLHDVRWGDVDRSGTVNDYVWVFLISGSAPPAHFERRLGRRRRLPPTGDVLSQRRQHAPRHLEAGRDRLVANLRRGRRAQHGHRPRPRRFHCRARKPSAAGKPPRPQWPIMHAVLYGVSRDAAHGPAQKQPRPSGLQHIG